MKNLVFAVLFAVAALASSPAAQAADARAASWSNDGSWTYLGGALSLQHCAQIAGAQGYLYAAFGGYLWNGFQWTYVFNGCFGSGRSGGTGGGTADYDVYVKAGESAYSCQGDVEWEFGNDVRVRIVDEFSQSPRLEIKSRQPILDALCRVSCISSAYRINPNGGTAPTSCYNRN